jgi:ATP-dependent Clp protease ATP-binding subunit ClpA
MLGDSRKLLGCRCVASSLRAVAGLLLLVLAGAFFTPSQSLAADEKRYDFSFISGVNLENPTAADMVKIIDRLMVARISDAELSTVFEFFLENPSREVLEFVSMVLNQEIESENLNPQLVDLGLRIFREHARDDDLQFLTEFGMDLGRRLEDPRDAKLKSVLTRFQTGLDLIHLDCKGRPGGVISLYSVVAGTRKSLQELLDAEPVSSELADFNSIVSQYWTDELIFRRKNGADLKVYSRDEAANRIMDVLARRKDRLPLLVGDLGVGRNKVTYRLVQMIADGLIPDSEVHKDLFENAEVIQISLRAMEDRKMSLGRLQSLALKVQTKYRRRIILLIKDFDNFVLRNGPMGPTIDMELLRAPVALAQSSDIVRKRDFGTEKSFGYVPMIFTMKSSGFNGAVAERLKADIPGKYEVISVSELKDEDVVKILEDQWLESYQFRFGVKIEKKALELSVRNAQRLFPDDPKTHAAIKVLQDVAISAVRKDGAKAVVTGSTVSEYVGKRLGVPVDPTDVVAVQKYRAELKAALNAEVIGQSRMVSDVVDSFISLFQDTKRPVRSAMIMGPTGVGKTLLASKVAARAFGNPKAFLELQGSAIQEKEQLWTYFGAANGYKSADQTKGIVCDWLDDPTRGRFGGVIVINEAEKACSDFFTQIMEFLDSGVIVCGDGKPRYARNHLVLFTSNRGSKLMFPPTIANWTNAEIDARVAKLDSEENKRFFLTKTDGKDTKQLPIEILQRIDIFSPGAPMTRENAIKILQNTSRSLEKAAAANDQLEIKIDDSMIQHFVDARDYKSIGVRPIEREFEKFFLAYKHEILFQIQGNGAARKPVALSVVRSAKGSQVSALQNSVEMSLRADSLPTLPHAGITDPLNDPRFIELVGRLRSELESEVFGQEETLRGLANAVIAHRSDPGEAHRPLSVLMVGTTGSGKTEIGKALAQVLYGAKERAAVISFSGVSSEFELIKIMGAQGHDVGLFEQALMGNPDGGVIIMDEFSNMGGTNPAQKRAMLMKFYEMLEEGVWTSPVTGKTYPLSKYTLLWTGNDGELLFQGDTADDTRIATWKGYRSYEKLHKILLAAGIPQAFLGRMADLILMRPSTLDVMVKIVEKFMKPVATRFEKSQGIHIEVAEDFEEQMAATFFRNEAGARSLRDQIDIRLRGQLATAVINTKIKYGDDISGLKFKIRLTDSMVRTRAYSVERDGERKVQSEISVSRGEEVLEKFTEDFTEHARKEFRYGVADAAVTAFHEAGHAVVNDPEQTGQRTAAITIIGGEMADGLRYLGYARYEEEMKAYGKGTTRQTIVNRVARMMAGHLAQTLAGFSADTGWSNDLLKMRTLTTRYVLEWGLVPGLEASVLNEKNEIVFANLSESQKKIVYRAVDRMFADAEREARNSLRRNWGLVRLIVHELMVKGSLTGERLEELRAQAETKKTQWHVGWDFEDNKELMRPGESQSFKESVAKVKNSCEVFLKQKVLRRY